MTDSMDQLDKILERWESMRAAGRFATPEEACEGHPEFLKRAREYISAIEWVNRKGESFFDGLTTPGKRNLGRYELREIVGAGGYGTVWKAFDSELHREVAIKLPLIRFTTKGQRDAFIDEARSLAKLEHPNIVKVYDIAQEGNEVFIVSQLVEGSNLRGLISQGRTEIKQAIHIIQQIALALDYAHLNDVIHKDVKPANVLINESGDAYLADFGIATSGTDSDLQDTRGTLAYQSPEQSLAGDRVDHRSDIFSLSVVAYELLTGKLPFSPGDQCRFNRSEAVHPRNHNPSISNLTSQAILKGLSAVPSNRHVTASKFAKAIQPGFDWKPTLKTALGVIALALVATAGYLLASHKQSVQADKLTEPISKFNFDNSENRFENTGHATALELRMRGNTTFVDAPDDLEQPIKFSTVARLDLGRGTLPESKANGNGFTFAKHEITSGNAFSIRFWFCRESTESTDTLIHLGESLGFGKSTSPQLTIWLDDDDRLRVLSYDRFVDVRSGKAQLNETIDIGGTVGRWRHLEIEFETSPSPAIVGKGTFRAYVDRELVCEAGFVRLGVALRNSKSRLCIGAPLKQSNGSDELNFVGWIDDIELWNQVPEQK